MDTPGRMVAGIDLGTTFSAIAYVNDDGRPEVIRIGDSKKSIPSVVLIKDDEITVGEVARNRWISDEEHVVRWIKRAMGDENYRFQGMSAVEISAEILRTIKSDAESELGQSLEEVVITCPAYFNSIEIENTKKAGELAGLCVREIVKEPTAAAVYYGVENMRDGQTILVCDLGGGTFDATILKYEGGSFAPLASMGSRELGGHDWTMDLVGLVARRFEELHGEDPRNDLMASQKLYEDCEQAKRDFARVAQVAISCQYEGQMDNVAVTRDEFEEETEWRIAELVMWCTRAMEKVQMDWPQIDQILLVGGSSRLRRMALALEEVSGKKPAQTREPDLMVALGAAILAKGQVRPRRTAGLVDVPQGGLIDIDYRRIIPRSLGTRVIDLDGDSPRIVNSPIIARGTQVPDGGLSQPGDGYEVSSDGQEFIDIPVVEFEDDDEFDQNHSYRFTCRPGAKRGDKITVTFNYDQSGIITVEAADATTGQQLSGKPRPYEEPDIDQVVSIRANPRWVVFAIDTSYSMEGEKIENAKSALVDNAEKLLAESACKVGIVSFSSAAEIVCRPTDDLGEIRRKAASLQPKGLTAMDEGVEEASTLVLGAPAGTDRDVVLLTDGYPDDGRAQSTLKVSKIAQGKGVTLSVIGVGKSDVDKDFLDQISTHSLVIESAGGMAQAMTTLLTKSAAQRGGLTSLRTDGLTDLED